MAERPQLLALARVAELHLPSDSNSARRTSASSTTSSSDMERLHEELKLEIKPQRLQRQYTLNVPPSSADGARSWLQDAAPDMLEDVLTRWEKNQTKWRRLAAPNSQEDAAPDVLLEDGADLFERRGDSFDVTFGDGFLGLEFVFVPLRSKIVIKNVHQETWTTAVMHIPPGVTITRGLSVEAVNGRDVAAMSPEDVLDNLQFSKRPMTVTFRRANKSAVVCKLCETKVDADCLDEHTNYCVLSKRVELEADVINNALVKLTASINAMLAAEGMRPIFDQEEMHIYHALRVVAIQASTCDGSVDSFALCARLVKIIDRIRQQEVDTANFAVERGVKYCTKLRNLIHAKMSRMRASHKVMFQHVPPEVERLLLKRTKSLEDMENSDGLRAPRRASIKLASYRVSIRDFQIVKPISKGAFGKVYLARKKTTGDQYAIKVLAKEHLLRKKQIQQIETERNILASVVSPFVVKLFWTFQTKRNLFLVMEYLPGGDFMSLLECIVQLEEQVACVYIAEIAIALNHLHTKGCVHRDLKPDNILLSSTGHIKLTDFGLSEEAVAISDTDSEPDDESMAHDSDVLAGIPLVGASSAMPPSRPRQPSSSKRNTRMKSAYHTYGQCGTPDYLAPEIILGVPHGPPVDYWALGIILYEMLVGFPPFNDDTVDAIFGNILERQILWPDGEKCLSLEAMDLIDKMLDPNPATRMGWEGMKLHSFFEGINWDTILESVPPFVPTLEGPNDTSYFNNRNLTDIFIDDDEFDVDSRSTSSSQNNLDSGPESEDRPQSPSDPKEEDDCEVENNNASSTSAGTADVDMSWGTAGVLDALETTSATHNEHMGDGLCTEDDNSRYRFPSGMYGSPDDSNLSDAFRSFSFTNMNALAAASQAEADMITDTDQQSVANASGPSILI
ncbi:hypothetical protein PF005_g13714 [Phytophthora fragariae]|uniref:non-specific serine/threonine protein kinase n=1 Tax=Phytophthora fragariae TaxID=53985 RepID=A0A6A3K2M7_9STRA|nr:hypothetical protein PF011_g14209 [Phytophthora fragariae]KAE9103570.1 hypothetical protein PF007_g14363 [Phytophthora fragariae]KAE9204664.1 hypothetical protein PF005_g13714 [Phytophthora fragariae]KAE9222696.1 hypothetical protein PF002_g15188 [Phytophthora fragariae]